VFADIKDKSADIKREIAESVAEFHRSRDSLLEKVETDIDKVYGKLRTVENTIDDSKSKLIASFADEVQKIRTEIDNLSIHSIAKKDEIVKAARKEAEETIAKIEDFDEKYAELKTAFPKPPRKRCPRLSPNTAESNSASARCPKNFRTWRSGSTIPSIHRCSA
jgi:hypothetical protein